MSEIKHGEDSVIGAACYFRTWMTVNYGSINYMHANIWPSVCALKHKHS